MNTTSQNIVDDISLSIDKSENTTSTSLSIKNQLRKINIIYDEYPEMILDIDKSIIEYSKNNIIYEKGCVLPWNRLLSDYKRNLFNISQRNKEKMILLNEKEIKNKFIKLIFKIEPEMTRLYKTGWINVRLSKKIRDNASVDDYLSTYCKRRIIKREDSEIYLNILYDDIRKSKIPYGKRITKERIRKYFGKKYKVENNKLLNHEYIENTLINCKSTVDESIKDIIKNNKKTENENLFVTNLMKIISPDIKNNILSKIGLNNIKNRKLTILLKENMITDDIRNKWIIYKKYQSKNGLICEDMCYSIILNKIYAENRNPIIKINDESINLDELNDYMDSNDLTNDEYKKIKKIMKLTRKKYPQKIKFEKHRRLLLTRLPKSANNILYNFSRYEQINENLIKIMRRLMNYNSSIKISNYLKYNEIYGFYDMIINNKKDNIIYDIKCYESFKDNMSRWIIQLLLYNSLYNKDKIKSSGIGIILPIESKIIKIDLKNYNNLLNHKKLLDKLIEVSKLKKEDQYNEWIKSDIFKEKTYKINVEVIKL